VRRAWRGFVDFWVEFLIGDTPEFLVVTLVVVGLAFLFADSRVAGTILLPLIVAGAVAVSAWRVRGRRDA
jgi:hypothetical protein